MASKFKETNRFIVDEFLDTFGREFCKHEVLWKSKPNCKGFGIQSSTHIAYRRLAQTLNLSVEVVLELLETFPAACHDLISRYELCRKVDPHCHMPVWLTVLARHSRFLNSKNVKSALDDRSDLVRALCESARVGLGAGPAGGPRVVTGNGMEDEASLLRGPRAVAYFVERHGVSEEKVLPAWWSALELCLVKLRAVLAVGDRASLVPAGLRPAAAERAVADLALLHDRRVSQITLLTPAKLRTLVLLFQLIVAAKERYDGEWRLKVASREEAREVRSGESAAASAPTSDESDGPPESADSGRIKEATSAPSGLYSVIEEFSVKCVEPSSAGSILRERAVDFDDVEGGGESSDDELHVDLGLEPDILVVSSDTSDCEVSDKYLEECSKDNTEVPVSPDKDLVEESGCDVMEKNNLSYRERESVVSPKSQNAVTTSDSSTQYCNEESESNASEVRKAVWAMAYSDFLKRGRSASLISLQHRWVELLHLARVSLLRAWSAEIRADRNVHPLLLVVAHWIPEIVTENLPPWKKLVLERQIVLESDIKDMIHKYQENDNVLLNVTENLTFPDLIKNYVNNKNVNPLGQSKRIATNKHLSYQIHKKNIINNTDKVLEQESQAEDKAIINELNDDNCISRMLDQMDPSKAVVSIVIDEDSDEDASTLNHLDVSESERGTTYLREENNLPYALEKSNKDTEINMKNMKKGPEDKQNYMNNPELNENILQDKQTVSEDVGTQDESSSLQPHTSEIDEKLVNLSRIVITPIELLPQWKKHSVDGVIKCSDFSVENFTKPVATSNQLSKCTPYINSNKDHFYTKSEVRIKFEDDGFETDFSFGDDINNGIKYQKYIELYTMPDHLRNNRIQMTRKLKLSRTYFSLNFWSLDSNIELMKLCKPLAIKLNNGIPRVAKRVELSDITEVRRINRAILTAQVSPTMDTTTQAQRSSASPEEASSTNNSISSNSDTIRTTNSLYSALDSAELLKLLTNYAIQTKIPQKSVITKDVTVTKDITFNSNFMDSILDTMRLADKNNIQNSTVTCTLHSLQQSSLPNPDTSEMLLEPCNTNISKNISASQTFNTIQKSTDEPRNNLKLNSIHNSLPDATTSNIPYNYTKELYIKPLQKMNNVNNTSVNLEETEIPNVGHLKHMILLIVKNYNAKIGHDCYMKLNRTSLNLHLKNFEKQQRELVKNISKLTKILPQYVINMEPKRSLTDNARKRKRKNRKQSKEHSTLTSSNTENKTDIANNTNTASVDDDCEPNLVTDESLKLSDNIYLNNSQCNKINTNKNTQETFNTRKNDKKEKHIKKAKKKTQQSKNTLEMEKPMLNEYQEWHRQKTMALKYFTLPMSDSSKLTSKDKIAQQQNTMTITEQQSTGSQTNIPIKRKNTEDLATTPTEQQSSGSQTNVTIKRKNTEDLATTPTEQQSSGSQTNVTIKRKNTEDLATTPTEQQSSGSQTNVTIKRKNTEDLATTPTEQQSSGSQTNVTIKRKNTEDLATTPTEQQSSGSQTNVTIKRKNTEDLTTTPTEQQSSGSQTNVTIKRKNTEDLATTPTEQQSSGSQTNVTIKRKNTENFATTSTEQQSSRSQTNIPIKRKNTEDLTTTPTEQQNTGTQTNITIKRKNTEDLTTTPTEQQSSGCQTNITIKRKNTEDLTTTPTEQQITGTQTNITIKRKSTENFATTSTEQQSSRSQTNIPIKRKNTEDLTTTPTEQQNTGTQTNITIKRKNTEDLTTTPTEQQSSGCQTNITIKRKNTEDLTTTPTEQQNTGTQTNITIKRKSTENFATTSTEQQSSRSQTNIPIKRKNTEYLTTTPTEQQNTGTQTNITIKRKSTENFATTSTEQQSSGSQTNIPIKRKNTEDFATTSTASDITKRPKLHSNENNVVYISDTSSDDDVQITECFIAKDTNENKPNTAQPEIHHIDKTENGNNILTFNDTSQKQAVNPNVINTTATATTQPLYFIINDTQVPIATQDAINETEDSETMNNPVVFQVLSNGTPLLTLTQAELQNETQETQQVLANEPCKLSSTCNCSNCENTLRDDISTYTLDIIQNVTSEDSRNSEPSTSVSNQNAIKAAITVNEYLSASKKFSALIKVCGSQKLLFCCNKYIILTDVNIPNSSATYSAAIKVKNKKKLSRVLVPSDTRGSVLLLGIKNVADYLCCKCLKGTRVKCNLYRRIWKSLPHPPNLLKINNEYYKCVCHKPYKYVRLSANELVTNSRAVLEGNPDLLMINKMFFKKLKNSPLTYVRILSAPQDTATLRHLVRKEVLLYAFDVTNTLTYFTPLVFAHTHGQVTVTHDDEKLVKVLQWILN